MEVLLPTVQYIWFIIQYYVMFGITTIDIKHSAFITIKMSWLSVLPKRVPKVDSF